MDVEIDLPPDSGYDSSMTKSSRSVLAASPFTKIAVTVPTGTYLIVERLRRELGQSRSAVVASALAEWVRATTIAEAERRYVAGYRRMPETSAELAGSRAVAAQATSQWSAWAPGEPSRLADPVGMELAHRARARRSPATGRSPAAKRSHAAKRSRR
jgi:hypothetical protein